MSIKNHSPGIIKLTNNIQTSEDVPHQLPLLLPHQSHWEHGQMS
jgi:hypothetical protein